MVNVIEAQDLTKIFPSAVLGLLLAFAAVLLGLSMRILARALA